MSDTDTKPVDYAVEIEKRLGTWIRIADGVGTTYFMPLNMTSIPRDPNPGIKGVMRDDHTGLASVSVPIAVVSKWLAAMEPRL